jgi:hypothetical protein
MSSPIPFTELIPPELRNQIYHHVLLCPTPIDPLEPLPLRNDPERRKALTILHLNRQIRFEALSLYHSEIYFEQSFATTVTEKNKWQFIAWLSTIPPTYIKLIPSLHINLRPSEETLTWYIGVWRQRKHPLALRGMDRNLAECGALVMQAVARTGFAVEKITLAYDRETSFVRGEVRDLPCWRVREEVLWSVDCMHDAALDELMKMQGKKPRLVGYGKRRNRLGVHSDLKA